MDAQTPVTDTLPDDGIERFRCADCERWMPVQYRTDERLYGLADPVCSMCLSYWEYLTGPRDEEDE